VTGAPRPGGAEGAALLGGVVAVIAGGLAIHGAASLAASYNGAPAPAENPVTSVIRTVTGRQAWTGAATAWLVAEVLVLAVVAALALLAWPRWRGRRRLERRAAHLPADRNLNRYLGAERGPGVHRSPGPQIGFVIQRGRVSRKMMRMAWEDVAVLIAGARTGKTTAMAIPAIVDAPGAVVCTSNKPDLVQTTALVRAGRGAVWVFDPQHVAGERQPGFWWDPLATVTDLRTARRLAAIWDEVGRQPGDRADAYFDPAGRELLANLLLAAGVADLPLTVVHEWLADPDDRTAARILEGGGHHLSVTAVEGFRTLPDKQRAGVYGTAAQTVAFLADPAVVQWIVDPGDGRPRFDPARFATSSDTLYSLSREGEGSSAPLVTALTAAVLDAAEAEATRQGGRLAMPLLGVLDEAANVCRWKDLPDLYSHYGSRGIVLITILQSWSQGVAAWGEHGMEKLWGAANVRIYGGGSAETAFLERVASLCGEWEAPQVQTSSGSGQRSTSRSTRRELVFDVATLAALPPGRAVVMASATRAVLVAPQPWMQGPHAEAIHRASDASRVATFAAADPAVTDLRKRSTG
jgi:type IV secretory pathway TraG/TraD family ATPase VirD4